MSRVGRIAPIMMEGWLNATRDTPARTLRRMRRDRGIRWAHVEVRAWALRWALVQAADCVRGNDPYFGDYYDRKKGEDGKHHHVALSSVARKLMGVWRSR